MTAPATTKPSAEKKPGSKPVAPGVPASTPSSTADKPGVPMWAVGGPAAIAGAMWVASAFGPVAVVVVGAVGLLGLLVWRLSKRPPREKGKGGQSAADRPGMPGRRPGSVSTGGAVPTTRGRGWTSRALAGSHGRTGRGSPGTASSRRGASSKPNGSGPRGTRGTGGTGSSPTSARSGGRGSSGTGRRGLREIMTGRSRRAGGTSSTGTRRSTGGTASSRGSTGRGGSGPRGSMSGSRGTGRTGTRARWNPFSRKSSSATSPPSRSRGTGRGSAPRPVGKRERTSGRPTGTGRTGGSGGRTATGGTRRRTDHVSRPRAAGARPAPTRLGRFRDRLFGRGATAAGRRSHGGSSTGQPRGTAARKTPGMATAGRPRSGNVSGPRPTSSGQPVGKPRRRWAGWFGAGSEGSGRRAGGSRSNTLFGLRRNGQPGRSPGGRSTPGGGSRGGSSTRGSGSRTGGTTGGGSLRRSPGGSRGAGTSRGGQAAGTRSGRTSRTAGPSGRPMLRLIRGGLWGKPTARTRPSRPPRRPVPWAGRDDVPPMREGEHAGRYFRRVQRWWKDTSQPSAEATSKGSGIVPLAQTPRGGTAAGAAGGDDMPKNTTGGSGGLTPSGGGSRLAPTPEATRGGSGAGPWQGVVDAADRAASIFSDPVAMDGIRALDGAADAIEGLGKALQRVGQTAASNVAYDSRVLPYFEELGRYVIAAAVPTRDGAAAVRRAHAKEIQDIEEQDPRKIRFGIAENRGH